MSEMQVTKAPKERVLERARCVTDELGLVCFLIFLFTWIGLWGYGIYVVRDSIFSCGLSNCLKTKTSCASNTTHMNSSSDALNEMSLSINSIIHILNNSQLCRDFYFWHAAEFVKSLAPCYFLFNFFWPAVDMALKREPRSSHILIVNTGQVIITLIFTIGFFSRFHHSYEWSLNEILIFFVPALCTYSHSLALIMIVTFAKYKHNLHFNKSELWCYINCRYLLLFRLLNFMVMVLLLAANIILSKHLCTNNNYCTILFITTGSFFMIFFLNNYGKTVIMAASANHDWSDDRKAISIKHLISAIFIVGKFHVGTIFLNTLFIRRIYTLGCEHKLPQRDVVMQLFGKYVDIVPYIVERSAILTAMHGQTYEEAYTNMMWTIVERKNTFDARSLASVVWKDMSFHSLTMAMVLALMPISNVNTLLLRMIAIGFFFAVQGLYTYIVNTMDTINYTVEFCKEEYTRNNITKKD